MKRFDEIFAKLESGKLTMDEVDWPLELAMIGLGEAMAFRKQAGDHPLVGEIVDILRANDTFLVPVRNLLADLLARVSFDRPELEAARAVTFGGASDVEGEPSG